MYPEREKNPERIERILRELMDVNEGSDFCHRIVQFGRDTCTARSPKCTECPLADLCEKAINGGLCAAPCEKTKNIVMRGEE